MNAAKNEPAPAGAVGPDDHVIIIGGGYSAGFAMPAIVARGARLTATTRSPERFARLTTLGATPVLFDGTGGETVLAEALSAATHIIVSAPPGPGGDPLLTSHADDIAAAGRLRWIGLWSTLAVYGDAGGAWIDETAPCRATSQRGLRRLEAEHDWRRLAEARGIALATLRLAGIYGPGRNALANLAAGAAHRIVKPGQVFNRIHADDIAALTLAAADRGLDGIFNLCDSEPAPPQDVVTFAAALMGVAPPPEEAFDTATLSPMARSFYADNKRVSGRAVLEATGSPLLWPDYRAGIAGLWQSGRWRG